MPAPTDPKLKAAIEQAYVNSNLSPKELSEKFDDAVSDRTIERWIEKEGWDVRRKANNVIEFAQRPKSERPSVPNRRQIEESINDLVAIEGAIAAIYAAMTGGSPQDSEDGVQYIVDSRSLGSCASALVKLLEYRGKIQPKTATELVKQAIALGYSPDTFMQALRDEWRQQKA